jgi:hypothetical protein
VEYQNPSERVKVPKFVGTDSVEAFCNTVKMVGKQEEYEGIPQWDTQSLPPELVVDWQCDGQDGW